MNTIEQELSQAPDSERACSPSLATSKRRHLVGPVYSMNKKLAMSKPNVTFSRTMKATIAVVTVTASLIGAVTTISSFAHTVTPVIAPAITPAPIFNNVLPTVGNIDPDSSAPLAAFDSAGKPLGQCPLTHTSMEAKLSGYMARVDVTQVFTNPFKERIEATYSFPLSDESAVDDMTIKIGQRTIKGVIKTKEAAKQIYQAAKNAGHNAALLNQERTNIFIQHVANIDPGQSIVVQLSYVELLKFEDGKYTFAMPTAIGPRFYPNKDASGSGSVSASDSLAHLISEGNIAVTTGTGSQVHVDHSIAAQNLSISVDVDAGMPIKNLTSKLFPILEDKVNANHSVVSLQKSENYPNKDFVLTYELDNPNALKSGYLTYRDDTKADKDGYATFMMLPPAKVTAANAAPKEMIFLVDCSGSQRGKPIAKAKETLHYIVNHMNAHDTFQILAFNHEIATLSKQPIKAGLAEKLQAHNFISRLNAAGGTWMQPAVERALKQPSNNEDGLKRLRIVTFMTDGFVGNDIGIMALVQKERKDSRWFAFGTGDGVNRALINNVSRLGGGESEFVLLDSSAEEVGKKFYSRISSPALTDVKLKAEGIELYDVYPAAVADVWANKPLYFTARYRGVGPGKVVLSGFANGRPFTQTLNVTLPYKDTTNSAIEKVWARQKITALTDQDLPGLSSGTFNARVKREVTALALKHRLMSDFTSFVAVDNASEVVGANPSANQSANEDAEESTDSADSSNSANSTNLGNSTVPLTAAPPAVAAQTPVAAVQPANFQSAVAPEPAPQLVGATMSGYIVDSSASSGPSLGGATNGTIGPMGLNGITSAVVQGVNTAGTVKVNNLANLEGLANLVANGIEILGIGWGAITLFCGVMEGRSILYTGRNRMIFAVLAIFIGLATPACINLIFSMMRDSVGLGGSCI